MFQLASGAGAKWSVKLLTVVAGIYPGRARSAVRGKTRSSLGAPSRGTGADTAVATRAIRMSLEVILLSLPFLKIAQVLIL